MNAHDHCNRSIRVGTLAVAMLVSILLSLLVSTLLSSTALAAPEPTVRLTVIVSPVKRPNIKPQVAQLIDVPLRQERLAVAPTAYLDLAKQRGLAPAQWSDVQNAAPLGQAAGLTHVLVLKAGHERKPGTKRTAFFIDVSLVETASAKVVLQEIFPLKGPRMGPPAARLILTALRGELSRVPAAPPEPVPIVPLSPPPAAPEPVGMPLPPPPAPVSEPPPPATQALSDNANTIAPVAPVGAGEPAVETPPAAPVAVAAVTPAPVADANAPVAAASPAAPAANPNVAPAPPAPVPPATPPPPPTPWAFNVTAGGSYFLRTADIGTTAVTPTPCDCGKTFAPGALLVADVYPLSTPGGQVRLGAQLRLAVASGPNGAAGSTHDLATGLVLRLGLVHFIAGYDLYSFPAVGAQFPAVAIRAPYAGVSIRMPVNPVATLVMSYRGMGPGMTWSGDGAFGAFTKGSGHLGQVGLSFALGSLELTAAGFLQQLTATFAGATAIPAATAQGADITVSEQTLGGVVSLGLEF